MEKICESLKQTRNSLATYQFLNDQLSSNQVKIAPKSFQTISNAVLHEAILGITRLADENQESINFKLLLDMAENHPRLFKCSPVEMRTLVESNRLRLASLGMLLKGLRSLRDRKLAHLDRKQLNDPASVSPEPIQAKDLSHCVDVLTMILSDLWQAFYGSPYPEDREDSLISMELETLWMIVGKSVEMMGYSE